MAEDTLVDVAIVGGGLAGSLAAFLLGRAGHRVAMIDLHAEVPREFRVDKIAGDQVEAIRRFGLLEALAAGSTRVDRVFTADRGRIVGLGKGTHFSLSYAELVTLVRAQIPPSVDVRIGRVSDVVTGPEEQRVVLSNGRTLRARLVVVATGQAEGLRERLGIGRRDLLPDPTICFGFDVAPTGADPFPFEGFTYYGERPQDGVDYLALLRTRGRMRANLFAFQDHRQGWVRAFRSDPTPTLARVLPGLQAVLGGYEVVGKVQSFVMRLVGVEDACRDGVVLIGDAFQTNCPAAGRGTSRVFTDVDRLCNIHLPGWLATDGMAAGKIAAFYADPEKQRCDEQALETARFRRGFALQPDLRWKMRRSASFLKSRIRTVVASRRLSWSVSPSFLPAPQAEPQRSSAS